MKDIAVIGDFDVLENHFKIYGTKDEPLFLAKDIAGWLGLSNTTDMISRVDTDEVTKLNLGGLRGECNFLTEDGLYEVLMQSRKPIAKQFKKEVKRILKTIRKTGGFVSNEDAFVATYLPYADDATKEMFSQTLQIVRHQNEVIQQQKEEITYKEDVIIGLVDDIDLATKRQRITQIIRHGASKNYQERYSLLYAEFERKYHIDLKSRMKSCDIKPKIKNKMDYIDRGLKMIPQLYEICCKIFENDVENLKSEWDATIISV